MAYTHYKIKELFAKILENLLDKQELLDFGGSLNSTLNWAHRFGNTNTQWKKGATGHGHNAASVNKSATPLFYKCKPNTVTGFNNPVYTWEEVSLSKSTGELTTTGKYYVYRGGVSTWTTAVATVADNGVLRQMAKFDLSELMLDPTTDTSICFFSARSARIIGTSARLCDNGTLYLNILTESSTGATSSTTINLFIYEPSATTYDVVAS